MYENEPGRKPLCIELHRLCRFPMHTIVSGLEEATPHALLIDTIQDRG
jgi:hypothetical protein